MKASASASSGPANGSNALLTLSSRASTPQPDAATVSPVQASAKTSLATQPYVSITMPEVQQAPASTSSLKGLSNIGALAKRSVSATGLTRRPSSRDAVGAPSGLANERTTSDAGQPRSKSAAGNGPASGPPASERRHQSAGPPLSPQTTGTEAQQPAVKGLMMALLHPRASTTPVPTPSPSPVAPSTPVLNGSIDGGSHISRVAARLSELINRMLPAAGTSDASNCVVVRGRCSARQDKAREFGDLIYSEIVAAASDQYLLRTLLRSAVSKSLSVLLSRLEGLFLTFAADPASATLPKTTKDTQTIVQRFNLENVKAAYEIRESLDRVVCNKDVPAFARDACLPWVHKFDTLVGQIVNPLLLEIKRSVGSIIARARNTVQRTQSNSAIAASLATQNGVKLHSALLESVVGQPAYLLELAHQLEASLLLLRSLHTGKELEKWIVGIATFLTWKGMLAFAARPCPASASASDEGISRPQIPPRKSATLRSRSAIPLLRASARRSPSPPGDALDKTSSGDQALNNMIKEVAAFRALVTAFSHSVSQVPFTHSQAREDILNTAKTVKEMCEAFDLLPELDSDNEGEDLVHEAMHEALLALGSFELTLRSLKWPDEVKLAFLYDDDDSSSSEDDADSRLTPSNVFNLVGPASPAARVAVEKAKKSPVKALSPAKLPDPTLDRALDTMPPLITFHVLASRLPTDRCHNFRLPHVIWKLPGGWDEYATQLSGFSTGESFAEEVGWQMVSELDRLKTEEMDSRGGRSSEGTWEDLLRVAVMAECGE